jgi:hypothetical protein
MLKPGPRPDTFLVDFAAVSRGAKKLHERLFGPRGDAVVVDGWAVAQVVRGALAVCPTRSALGKPQLWNEFRLFLSREDHDAVRPLERALQADLGPMLYEELARRDGVTVGGFVVRLLVDDADEVRPGGGVLQCSHAPDPDAHGPAAGEVTVRLDKPLAATRSRGGTERVGVATLRSPAGTVPLPSGGGRLVVGRADPDAGPDHVAIPGASGRISRRHFAVAVADGQAEITREAGSNPVSVAGQALAPGQSVTVALPVEVALSGGELRVTIG